MNFKPSNFYISIIDLFAILLPGAITSLVIYHFNRTPIDSFLDVGTTNAKFYNGFVLLFASYLFGHIISQVSAYLDEWIYDRLKEKIFKDHKCVEKVMEIRKDNYNNVLEPVYVNSYKWSVFKLQKEYPDAAAEVDRYMADSKFFRSLFIILLVLTIVFCIPPNFDIKISIISFLLATFSMIRYFKKRRKSTETAYQYIIFTETLNTIKDNSKKEQVLALVSIDKTSKEFKKYPS